MSNSTHFDGLIEPTLSLFGIDIQCKEHIPALNESQMLELLQSFYDISEDSDHNENAYDFTNKIKILTFLPIYVLVFIIGLVGNGLVIYLIYKVKKLRSITSLFLTSLALADLLLIVICVPIKIAEFITHGWIFGNATCKVFHYLHIFTAICSVMNLTAVSLERYFAIIHPLKAKIRCTYRRAKIIIVIVWILSFFAASPILLGKDIVTKGFEPHTIDACVRVWCPKIWQLFELYRTTIILIIPFAILVYCYVRICKELYSMPLMIKKSNKKHNEPKTETELELEPRTSLVQSDEIVDSAANSSSLKNSETTKSHTQNCKSVSFRSSADDVETRRQIIRILISIVGIFFICWAPIMINNILVAFNLIESKAVDHHWYIRVIFHLLAYINSCVNPIVYGFMSKRFREGFRKVFCSSSQDNHMYASIEIKTSETNPNIRNATARKANK